MDVFDKTENQKLLWQSSYSFPTLQLKISHVSKQHIYMKMLLNKIRTAMIKPDVISDDEDDDDKT